MYSDIIEKINYENIKGDKDFIKVIQNIKQDTKFGYGEDSKFVRDVIRNGYDVIYTDDKLSHYYFKRSATFGK